MYEDQVEGKAKNLAGKVQEGVGEFFGDADTQAAGKLRQASGALQQTYGEAVDKLSETTRVNPIGALLVAAGLGFVLGKVL